MPIYEYCCQSCGHNFEYLVMGGHEPESCPACEAGEVCRQLSVCGFFSKGAGGETVSASAGSSSCGGCTANTCAGCGH